MQNPRLHTPSLCRCATEDCVFCSRVEWLDRVAATLDVLSPPLLTLPRLVLPSTARSFQALLLLLLFFLGREGKGVYKGGLCTTFYLTCYRSVPSQIGIYGHYRLK